MSASTLQGTSQTTLLPNYVGLVQDTSLNFYNQSTNLLNTLGNYLAEINENIKFNKALVTTNVLSAYTVLFNELQTLDFTLPNFTVTNGNVVPNGVKMLDENFKLYFVEKYLSLTDSYKTVINKGITNNSYFAPFSDDIGFTINPTPILDNNTSPYFDVYTLNYLYLPNIPATLLNKVSLNEQVIMKSFSVYGDALLKLNLQGLQYGNLTVNTASTSHGTNLINDVLYYNRAVQNQHSFLVVMQGTLNIISDFIQFFININPKDCDPERKSIFFKYTITNMEQMQVQVDVLKNNLTQVLLSSKVVLGVPLS